MKRLTTLLLMIVALLTFLTACSSSDSNDSNQKDGKKKTIVIGIDDKFAPMGFRDENNEIVGFDIDLARAAAEKMDVEVKFQPIDWKTKEAELSSGRIDLIWNGYTITESRKEQVLFTKPYLENAQVVITSVDSSIQKLDDLADKNVGIQALSSAAQALEAHPVKDSIKQLSEYGDNVLALTDLKTGRTDAVVIDSVVAEYYLTLEPNTFKILDESLAPELYGVGVALDNEELLTQLQKALDELNKDGTAAEISTKWFGEDIVLK